MTINIINSDFAKHNNAELFLGKAGLPTKKTNGYKFTPLSKIIPNELNFNETSTNFESNSIWNESCLKFSGGKLLNKKDFNNNFIEIEETTKENYNKEIKNSFQALSVLRIDNFYKIKVSANTKINNFKIENFFNLAESNNYDAYCIDLEIGENSSVDLFEINKATSNNQSIVSAVMNIKLARNATLRHYSMTEANEDVSLIINRFVTLLESSTYTNINFDGGSGLNRNDIEVVLKEKYAHTNLYGLYALKENQFSDNFINVHHQAAETTSNQLFKGILKDKSRAVFTGKVLVDAGANLVNSSQLNKNILLDNSAHVQTEPQLEVYTDDVKCGHGATVGQLSDEEIFYLESRGISKEHAFQLLCQAYANEILSNIESKEVMNFFKERLYGHFDFSSMAKNLIESKK